MSMKNPLILAGIEPATFRVVAQYLNHCYRGPPPPPNNQKTLLSTNDKKPKFLKKKQKKKKKRD